MFNRIVWIVLDSVGIGEMPDAAAYGDAGSDTLGNLARLRPLRLPNMCRLGLGNLVIAQVEVFLHLFNERAARPETGRFLLLLL